ncbi:hypothetical protein CPB83DRAFT_853328, partial [Crepidotus variabilis]
MPSLLEALPLDIVLHCAILSGSTSTFEPPTAISRLSQTSSALHNALDTRISPNVYGQVFSSKFDKAALYRRSGFLTTDSALAFDLQSRYQLLRRVKTMGLSPTNLVEDLWTALWMFLESDGLNERQLQRADFASFMLTVAKFHLGSPDSSEETGVGSFSFHSLVVWLLAFTLSRQVILMLSAQDRDQLYGLIFPYILWSNKAVSPLATCRECSRARYGCVCPEPVIQGLEDESASRTKTSLLRCLSYRGQLRNIPHPSLAAINIACAIMETTLMRVPPHFPENRAIANAAQLHGPTQEDYRAWASYRTSLFADSVPNEPSVDGPLQSDNSLESSWTRSMLHELEFRDLLQSIPLGNTNTGIKYIPGSLTGVWEGTYRRLPLPSSVMQTTDVDINPAFSKPIQCSLTEYINIMNEQSLSRHAHALNNISVSDFFLSHDSSELSVRGGSKYRKLVKLDTIHPVDARDNTFFNVMLHGETLNAHDTAWGGFKFWGGVYEDGRIVLKRSAKNDGDQGSWIFEGRLKFGTAFLGRWRVSGEPTNVGVDHGVFSMGNHGANWKRE